MKKRRTWKEGGRILEQPVRENRWAGTSLLKVTWGKKTRRKKKKVIYQQQRE